MAGGIRRDPLACTKLVQMTPSDAALLDTLTTPLLRLDAQGVVAHANAAMGRWLGVSVRRLAGLHAALSAASHPWVATAPCDSPFLPTDLVARLSDALITRNADLAVARTFDQPHPVFCLCKRDLLPHLTAYLASGERKFDRWYATLQAVEVAFDDEAAAFENINTRDELHRFDAAGPAHPNP